LFQLKQSLASINFKIKITNLLVTSLNQHVLLTISYYNKLVNLRPIIQKLNSLGVILPH
jgi:hypothetical protein